MSTEPAPTQASDGEPKVPPCAACGGPSCPNPTYPTYLVRSSGEHLCAACWCKSTSANDAAIAARRISSPAPADELVVGAEYEGLGSPESKVSDQWFRGKWLK